MTAVVQAPPEPTLGRWMRETREGLEWKQAELADRMDMPKVNQMAISRWERGEKVPNVFEMRRFAEVTGAEYLYDLRGLPIRWTTPDTLAA